jgi:hypothetical protein
MPDAKDSDISFSLDGVPHGPEFPVGFNGFHRLHAPFLNERRTRGVFQGSVQEIRGVCAGVAGALHGLKKMGRSPFRCCFFASSEASFPASMTKAD